MIAGVCVRTKLDDHDQLVHAPAFIHVAAGRGCARAVHAAIIHAADNDTSKNMSKHHTNHGETSDLPRKVLT